MTTRKRKRKVTTDGGNVAVRLRPGFHPRLRALKDKTRVPIESLVADALRAFFESPTNRKILKDAGLDS